MVLGVTCTVFVLIGLIWSMVYFCMDWCSKRKTISKPSTYKLIEDTDDLPPCELRRKKRLVRSRRMYNAC